MKNCDEMQAMMSAYLDGELEPSEKASMERHLDECEECANLAGELYEIISKLRSVPELKTPDNFHEEAMQKLRDRLNPVEIFTPKTKKEKRTAPAAIKPKKIPWRRAGYASGILVASMFMISILGSGIAERGSKNSSAVSLAGLNGIYSVPEKTESEPFAVGSSSFDTADMEATQVPESASNYVGVMSDTKAAAGDIFIKVYNVVIDVEDFDTAIEMIDSMPGTNVNMSVDYGIHQAASITRNISPSNYQYGKDFLRGLGTINNESESEQRISNYITELEAQLRAKEEEIGRLLVLLERSGTLSHLNAVESRIASVTGERDNIKTQIMRYNSQASNCVLNITISYTEPIKEMPPETYFERLRSYFFESLEFCKNAFENIIIFLSTALIPVIVTVVILAIVLHILRGRGGKNEK